MESSNLVSTKNVNCTAVSSSPSFRLRSPSLNRVRLRRIFDMFDKNNDSIISVDELGQALGLLGLHADPSEIELMVLSYSQPGSNGLTYQNFEDLHRSLDHVFFKSTATSDDVIDPADDSDMNDSDLNEAFKVFDENGDGYISAMELQVVLEKLGFQEEGRELDKVEMMISSVDRNHDGRVDFFEFKDMMRSVMVPN